MPLVSTITDTIYTYRFIKLLTTPFDETEAFKLGIIDKNGNRIKNRAVLNIKDRSAFTPFHKLVFSIKKLLAKVPGGKTPLASYAAALYLIKDNFKLKEENIINILNKSGNSHITSLMEDADWNKNSFGQLRKGSYYIMEEKLDAEKFDEVSAKTKIRASNNLDPVDVFFGINIYEVTSTINNRKLYVTSGELLRC